MIYKKGDKLKSDDEYFYYIDEYFSDEDQERILVCGGAGPDLVYIPENEVEVVEATNEEKILDVLVDLASTIKCLKQDFESVLLGASETVSEVCDDCRAEEEEQDDDEGEKKLN